MNITTFSAPIFVNKVKRHSEVKSKIIKSIESNIKYSIEDNNQKISRTDWHISEPCFDYWNILFPEITEIYNHLIEQYGYCSWDIDKVWYQWYENGDFHNPHTHHNCMFTNVYYLQLENNNPSTTFVVNKQEFQIEVTEGDVITFPSFLGHCSHVNNSNTPKIIISFNSNFNL